jgi:Putative Actinobacterial Holin-X, holin superfamily III
MPPVLESPPEPLETLFEPLEPVPTPVAVEPPPVQTAASLVSGILGDLQRLVQQQFQLTRMQIEVELRRRVAAAAVLTFGVLLLFVSAIFACLSVSHLLHWMNSPLETDLASLPLWACHAVVAAVVGLIGGILACVGRAQFRSIVPFGNPVTELVQEKLK